MTGIRGRGGHSRATTGRAGFELRGRVAVIVLSAALITGCAAGSPTKSSLERRLVGVGLKPAQATCVLDRMTAKFGPASLTARADPIAAETRAEKVLLRACGVSTSSPR